MRSIPVLLAGSLAACAHRASTPAPAAAAADAGWPLQQPWTAALEADLQAGDLDSARALLVHARSAPLTSPSWVGRLSGSPDPGEEHVRGERDPARAAAC